MRTLVLLLLVTLPVSAQTLPRNELGANIGVAELGDFGDAGTFSFAYNRYWTDALSSRFSLTAYTADLFVVDVGPGQQGGAGDLVMGAWSGALEYHFMRDRRFSPYVAAGLAFVATELSDTPIGDIEADSEITGLAGIGADITLTRRWAINLDAMYMPYDANFDNMESIDMDPLTYSAGVKFRW